MRKPFLALLALSFAASTALAQDREDSFYLDLAFGAVGADAVDPPGAVGEVEFDTGVATALAVGYPLFQTGDVTWSLEGELYYSYFKLDEDDLGNFPGTKSQGASTSAVMANLVADVPLTSSVSLYLGGGIGYAPNITYDTLDTGSYQQVDTDGSAAQFMIGLSYRLGSQYDFSLGYRYFATSNIDVLETVGNNVDEVEFANNVFELSFRWGL